MEQPANARKLTLQITGANEDRPRMLVGYGRIPKKGELALAWSPVTGDGVIVFVSQKRRGQQQTALIGRFGGGLPPEWPAEATSPAAASAAIADLRRQIPQRGTTSLRGRWTGKLLVVPVGESYGLQVHLLRRITTYGILGMHSCSRTRRWTWSYERREKWVTTAKEAGGDTAYPRFDEAFTRGLSGSMGLIEQACGFRDTHRRAAADPAWAEKHPLPGDRPWKRDRTAAFETRYAPIPAPQVADEAPPEVTPEQMGEVVGYLGDEADALARITTLEEPASGSMAELAEWFEDHMHEQTAQRIRAFAEDPAQPVDELLDVLKDMIKVDHDRDGVPTDSEERRMAAAKLEQLRSMLHTAPMWLARTRTLIRYAQAAQDDPRCKGGEKAEVKAALEDAARSYQQAHAAIMDGKGLEGVRTLRKIGERVALAAAKLARSCKLGQRSLLADVRQGKPPAAPPKKPRTPRKKPAKAPCAAEAGTCSPEVDPEKDAALVDAFKGALQGIDFKSMLAG